MKKIVTILSLSLVLVACSTVQEKVIENAMEENSGGDAEVSTSGKVPSDWPSDAPVYAGATVQYSASVNPVDGQPGSALILMSTDDIATVSAYYKAELVKQGWNMEGAMEGGGTTIIGASKDDRALSISITGADGQTTITIGVGKKG